MSGMPRSLSPIDLLSICGRFEQGGAFRLVLASEAPVMPKRSSVAAQVSESCLLSIVWSQRCAVLRVVDQVPEPFSKGRALVTSIMSYWYDYSYEV